MTLNEIRREIEKALVANGVDDVCLEAELIIRGALDISKVDFMLSNRRIISDEELTDIRHRLSRRCSGEPAAYILGHKEFFARNFMVNPNVLIPRPETEIMVEGIIKDFHGQNVDILDIGTGSGAIAVTLALEEKSFHVTAIDISKKALDVAKENAKRLGAEVNFIQSDLIENVHGRYDVIVANLPYVPENDVPKTSEPILALEGGSDGLNVIRRFIPKLPQIVKSKSVIWLEIAIRQYEEVERLCRDVLPSASMWPIKDLAGIDRFIKIETS